MTRKAKLSLLLAFALTAAMSCGGARSIDPVDGSDPGAAPNACETSDDCVSGTGCSSGVCVLEPPAGTLATLTDPHTDTPTTNAPNLSCLGATATPQGPATVTLYGAVTRFGSGLKTYDIEVSVFNATDYDPAACEDEPASDREACYRDYGTPIGKTLSVPVGTQELPETCEGHSDCPLGYRCIEQDLDRVCLEQFGLFEISGVPTNTPLVIRSRATESVNKWHDTYVVNVYLHADHVEPGDRVHFDATMVSHGQWVLTPNTVGLPDIAPENGAIGGRVRDCRTSERDSWPISEVTLGLANPGKKIVFFNNLEDDTVPMVDRVSTNILGRFAALDVPAGWNVLAGYARVGEENVSLGALPVYVFPNALTIVTWPGLQPHWAQK